MNPEDVGRILDEIGERIGPAGEFAWTITVRQVVIEGVLWTAVVAILLGFVLFVVGFRLPRLIRSGDGDYRGKGGDIFQVLLAEVTGFGLLLLVGGSLPLLLNPEYHAMIRLLERMVPQ